MKSIIKWNQLWIGTNVIFHPPQVSQMALINSSPEICQSKLEITIFILVGCLGYSNSAMNPILYAFLSDNFKKSFMKAFTCAKTKEINAQLQVENSFFPRFGRSRNSDLFSSKPTTNLVNNTNMTSKLASTKLGNTNTVESILDATYTNGPENGLATNGHHHNNIDGTLLNSSVSNHNVANNTEDESCDDDDEEQEMENQQNDNSICIINSNTRPPVLHTDL